jgi:hypothetical protein
MGMTVMLRMRAFFLALLSAVCVLIHAHAIAADAERMYGDANFRIVLPDGYLGPSEHIDGTSVSKGFRKPYTGTTLNTVILITVHEFGPSFEKRSAKEHAALTRETLEDIVAGIAKNRSAFRKGEVRPVTISGRSGLKVSWAGSVQGIPFEGLVYCVLAGSRAYAVQIQDPSGRGANRMSEATRAVENMRIGP